MNNHMPSDSDFTKSNSGAVNAVTAGSYSSTARTCDGQCVETARKLLDTAIAAASPLGKEKNDLSKRFQYLLDVSGDDRHKQAEVFSEHALALYEAMYGQEHPSVAQLLMDLGDLYTTHGGAESAEYVRNWAAEILNRPKEEPTHEFFNLFGMNKADDSNLPQQ